MHLHNDFNSYLIKKVQQFYPKPQHKTLLAFSGGRDSMILFHIFLAIQKINPGFSFETIHLNHLIRGNEEFINRAHDFVIRACEEYAVVLHHKILHVNTLAEKLGMTVEEAGRKARYDYFKEIFTKEGFDSITTAHHQNDQIETILMRIFKGTSLKGLKAIWNTETLIRPLIDIPRSEIDEFIETNQLTYMEDPTNSGLGYLRNRLRNQLMPLLETLFPSYEDALLRFQKIAAGASDAIHGSLPKWEPLSTFAVVLPLGSVRTMNDMVLGEVLIDGLSALSTVSPLGSVHIQEMITFLKQGDEIKGSIAGNKQILSMKGVTLWGSYDKLYWVNQEKYTQQREHFNAQKLQLEGSTLKVERFNFKAIFPGDVDIQVGRLTNFEEILFFNPKRKISKAFQDRKVPIFLRNFYWGIFVKGELKGLITPFSKIQFVHQELGVIF